MPLGRRLSGLCLAALALLFGAAPAAAEIPDWLPRYMNLLEALRGNPTDDTLQGRGGVLW